MFFFKKLFKKEKSRTTKNDECWYNNYQDNSTRPKFNPESADMGMDAPAEISSSKASY